MIRKNLLLGLGIISIVGLLSVGYAANDNDNNYPNGRGGGYGPGYMMGGNWNNGDNNFYCPGYGYRRNVEFKEIRDTNEARKLAEQWLSWQDNPKLKIGDIKTEKDGYMFDVVTKKESASVDTYFLDKKTGRIFRK